MKKCFIPFLLIFALFCTFFDVFDKNECCFAENGNTYFEVVCDDFVNKFTLADLYIIGEKNGLSKNIYSHNINMAFKRKLLINIVNIGIDKQSALNYCFWGLEEKYKEIEKLYNKEEINSSMVFNVHKNCFEAKKEQNGKKLSKSDFYNNFFDAICNSKTKIKLNKIVLTPKIFQKDVPIVSRGRFKTSFATSSPERKNNIRVATSKLNGVVIKPGDILSFNDIVGRRTEYAGFKQAKIIVDNQFVEGLGGGVCQVSTTLFNACLLSGLEIVESHQHSMKVSYVKEGFDAMVNYGSADLKVKNNTDKEIGILAKTTENECFFEVFGAKLQKMITLRSEVVDTIVPQNCEYVYDFELGESLPIGQNKMITNERNGLVVCAYIDYWDNNKKQVSKLVRKSKYNAVRGKIEIGTQKMFLTENKPVLSDCTWNCTT